MKAKIYTWALLAAAAMFAISCEGEGSEDDEVSGEIAAPFTISVDKSTIEADGEDTATFTVTDANGNILTETKLNYITFVEVNSGDKLTSKTNTFTSITNGEYEFYAYYKTSSNQTENTVKVTVQNRGKYETYFHKVVAYDITNVLCGYCPDMTAALEGVAEPWASHLEIFAIHGPYSASDPYILSTSESGQIANSLLTAYVGSASYPSCIINLNYTMTSSDRNTTSVGRIIKNQLVSYPSTCGIKINSTYSNGTVTLKGYLTSVEGGTYDLAYAVLANNQTYGSSEYNDIDVDMSSNFMTIKNSLTVAAGEEKEVTFTVNGVDASVVNTYGLSNLRVAVYALHTTNGTLVIDNLNVCPLGEDIDYMYND